MKELSIKEKAYDGNYKTYTELINRLEGVKDAIKKQNYGIAMDILCKPYPEYQITTSTELKESEDERIRENIIATIHLYYGEPLEDEAKEMIAWLEKQGQTFTKKDVDDAYLKGVCDAKQELEKQEWGEKDKDVIDTIIWTLIDREVKEGHPDEYEPEVNWLKSLRPHSQWKPSDEQMKALWEVYKGGEEQAALASLYSDLKKLKD